MAAPTYVSTDPTAGSTTPTTFVNTSPKAHPIDVQPGQPDTVAATWQPGQPVPAGYETYHPNGDQAILAIRQIGGYNPATATTATTSGGTTGSGAAPSITNASDPAQVRAWFSWFANQPGADPILKTPGGIDYYVNAWQGTGAPFDTGYWQHKATVASAGGAVGAGGGTNPFQVPSAADAANLPGIKFAEDMARDQFEQSAAAQGSLNTMGTQRGLAELAAQTALSQGYFPLAQLQLQNNQAYANTLLSLGQQGLYGSQVGSQ